MSASHEASPRQENSLVKFLKEKWLAIVLVILVVIFIAQNTSTVFINLLGWTLSSPLWVTLVIVLLIGTIVGYIIGRRKFKKP